MKPLRKMFPLLLAVLLWSPSGARAQSTEPLDLVISGGRVMDPETGLDAVRNVGIANGSIVTITEDGLESPEKIDATGLVVAPGFIDLHAHGQDPVSNRLQAADGVTTALEMEVGVYPVEEWLASREGDALIHYGATAGHWPARAKLMDGINLRHLPTLPPEEQAELNKGDHAYKEVSAEELDKLVAMLTKGLDEGGLGLGFGITYTPGASRFEILRLFELAADHSVAVYLHLRGKNSGGTLGKFQEAISNAASTGVSVHIVHMNSSADEAAKVTLGMIRGARERGLDVTTESYPYTAGSTLIQSALFDPWEGLTDEDYKQLQWPETGERLTGSTFRKYREQGGWVIIHGRTEKTNEWIVSQPDVMVASDGIPYLHGPAHPRGAGTFSRVLGHYVRERKSLSLMDALRKMTLLPAQRVEGASAQMKKKGRVQEDADADLTIFDPEKIIDRANYTRGDTPSGGIIHVLVGGMFVVRDSQIVEGVSPGVAIRGLQ